jgi:hypothetical protein
MTDLAAQIDRARHRSLAWLHRMQAQGAESGVSRISDAHAPVLWPGMLLPGTYNALMCRDLLGDTLPSAVLPWLLSHRRPDGVFRIPGMEDDAVFKKPDPDETWRYIDFHVTNYSLGAVLAVDPTHRPNLDFARMWLDPLTLKAWLAERDLRDPWQEGNNIVNLASFLLLMRHHDPALARRVDRALDNLFAWHDRLQEPATGFWGVGQLTDPVAALHAMAGSMHNFHLWYATGRPLAYQDRSVDYALSQAPEVVSACIDVDLIDLLVHAHDAIDYRRAEIREWLETLLGGLLAFQSADGGFADELQGIRRQDGWVRGYSEPQGISNSFATWFRWIAIAMAADVLWPHRWPWRFRSMIGIGYRGRTHTGSLAV